MAEGTKVTRIKATKDTPSAPKKLAKEPKKAKTPRSKKPNKVTAYFKGAWSELRQVRWPNRRATWGLTLAVILFSVFFMGLITLLDALFQFMFFELILT